MGFYNDIRTNRPFVAFMLNGKNYKKRLPSGTTEEQASDFEAKWREEIRETAPEEFGAHIQDYKPGQAVVYVIQSSYLFKIGFTFNLKMRFRDISISSPFECTLRVVIPTTRPRDLEAILHDKYQDKRRKGEWFSLNENDIAILKTLPARVKKAEAQLALEGDIGK